MASIADLYVAVRAQMDGFEKEVIAGATMSGAKAGEKAGDALNKSMLGRIKAVQQRVGNNGLVSALSSGLGFSGPLGLAVGGLNQLVSSLGQAGAAASDLSETESKLTQVFPDQAKAITAWAQTSAQAMGLSSKEALEAVGTFGNFLQAMGQTPDIASDMSQAMVQLASDLGSFNNQDPTQVLGALQSGLSGETEPLRRFGVDISDAAVQTELLSQGVQKVGKAFTQGQKIQGRYALIMKQTIKAQGDYGRTATGTANATRTAAAEQANLSAKVGKVVNSVQNVVQILSAKTAEGLVGALDMVSAGWEEFNRWVNPAVDAQNAVALDIVETTAKIRDQAVALEELVAAQDADIDTTAEVARQWQDLQDTFEGGPEAMQDAQQMIEALLPLADLARSANVGTVEIIDMYTALIDSGASVVDTQAAITAALMSTARVAAQLQRVTGTHVSPDRADAEVAARMAAFPGQSRDQIIEGIRQELRRVATDLQPSFIWFSKEVAAGTAEAAADAAALAARQSAHPVETAVGMLLGPIITGAKAAGYDAGAAFITAFPTGVAFAQKDVLATITNLRTAIKETLSPRALAAKFMGWELMKEVQSGLTSARPEVVQAARDTAAAGAAAIVDSGRKGPRAWRKVGKFVTGLFASGLDDGGVRAALMAAGMSEGAVTELLKGKRLERWRKAGQKQGHAAGVGTKEGMLTEQLRQKYTVIGDVIGKAIVTAIQSVFNTDPPVVTPHVGIPAGISTGQFQHRKGEGKRAAGGPVMRNTPYLIGERGPEMFVPSSNGTVVPNHALGGGRLDVFVHDQDGGLARAGIGAFALAGVIASQAQSIRRWED